MKSTIGNSSNANVVLAVEEATRQISEPQLIVFAAPHDALVETAKLIHEKYGEVPSIGTLGTTLSKGVVSTRDIVVVGMNGVEVRADIIEGLSRCPISHVATLEGCAEELGASKDNTVCFEFCTSEEERLVTTLNAGLRKHEVGVVGGTVFGDTSMIAYNGTVYEDACCYALIKNINGKVRIYKENIYECKDSKFHQVTKADPANRGLIELDYRPARHVYSEELGIPVSQIIDNVLVNPMGRVVGDEVYISSMREMTPEGTIINFKRVNESDTIRFLSPMDYVEVGKSTRAKIRKDFNKISLVLSVDCIYRYLLFDKENYINKHAQHLATLGPHMGVIGGGEQYYNQHVNQTMVCVVFE